MKNILQNKNFFLLWLGQTVSSAGGWINYVGLNVLLYQISGSGKLLGAFFVARLVPALFFGPIGGYLADRYDKRKLMIICDLVRALLVLVFIFITESYVFFILGFFLSVFDKIYSSASGAILPDLVNKEELLSANSLNRISQSVTTVIGPAIGGFLIGSWGYKVVFAFDSLTFFFSVVTLLFIKYAYIPKDPSEIKKRGGFVFEIKEAFGFMAVSSALLSIAFIRFFDGFASGAFNTVFPVFSTGVPVAFGTFYGWLLSFYGIGTLLGSSFTGKMRKKFGTNGLYCVSTIIMAVGLGSAFLFENPIISIACIAIGGVGEGISSVIFSTVIMEVTPKEILGKIYGTLNSLVWVLCGLGMMTAGFCLDYVKYAVITSFASILIIVFTLIFGLRLACVKKQNCNSGAN